MKQYDCSVVVVQYNPIWDKVERTLNSIISQKDCNFEIVIADDGSKNKYFEETIEYFQRNSFCDYKIVDNVQNQGTVKNVLSGLRAGSGKYARVIAPGDMLYSEDTLKKIVDFMEQNQAKEMFGKMVFFYLDKEKIHLVPQQSPCDFTPYKTQNKQHIKKKLLGLGDNISGASYSWDRQYYIKCLEKIESKVIYLEDCVNAYTLYEGNKICFMDEFVTWYEYGTGITTNKSSKWTQITEKDWCSFFDELYMEYPRDKTVKQAKLYYRISSQGTFLSKVIKNLLFFDRFLYGRIVSRFLMDRDYSAVDKEKLLKNL